VKTDEVPAAALTEAFGNNFLGSDQLPAPDKAALYPHDNAAIFLREFGRFVADDAVISAIHPLSRLDFFNVEAMKNFHERMDRVFQVIAPLGHATPFSLFLRGGRQLIAEPVQVVVEIDQIVDERFLERFMQKIVPVLEELGME
jgi:hypothetical protein